MDQPMRSSDIFEAAQKGNLEEVESFLRSGTTINAVNSQGDTALHRAVRAGHERVVAGLLTKNAHCDVANSSGHSLLDTAILNSRWQLIPLLAQKGSIFHDEHFKNQPLAQSALQNDLDQIQAILSESNPNPDHINTAIACAILRGHHDIVSILLQSLKEHRGASLEGHLNHINWYLKEKNAHAKKADHPKIEAELQAQVDAMLLEKAESGNEEAVTDAISRGARINSLNYLGQTALHLSSLNNHPEIVSILLNRQASVNNKNKAKKTALQLAAAGKFLSIVDALLKHGAYFTKEDETVTAAIHDLFAHQPLLKAIVLGNHQIADLLKNASDDELTTALLEYTVPQGNRVAVTSIIPYIRAKGLLEVLYKALRNTLVFNQKSSGENPENQDLVDAYKAIATLLRSVFTEMVVESVEHADNEKFSRLLEYLKRPLCKSESESIINNQTTAGTTALHGAVARGHMQMVEDLLGIEGAKVDCQDAQGRTPLHRAAALGKVEIVRLLINKTAKIDSEDSEKQTPLHCASERGHDTIVRLLLGKSLNSKASANAKNSLQQTPLHLASLHGHLPVVQILLEHGADIYACDAEESVPLHCAAANNHRDITEALLREDDRDGRHIMDFSTLERFSHNSETPLHVAARCGHFDLVRLFFERNGNIKASLNIKNNEDASALTPIQSAARGNHDTIVDYLLKKGAMLDFNDENLKQARLRLYKSLFMYKVVLGTIRQVDDLSNEEQQNPNVIKEALSYAIPQGSVQTVKTLISVLKKIAAVKDLYDQLQFVRQFIATQDATVTESRRKEYAEIQTFIQQEINDILLQAAESGDLRLVKEALEYEADITTADSQGRTALYLASSGNTDKQNGRNKDTIVKELINKKAELNRIVPHTGYTALHSATLNGREEAVRLLLEAKAVVDPEDTNKETPLHHAVHRDHFGIAKLLTEYKADVNRPTRERSTVLHDARDFNMVELLLGHGAYINAVAHNQTPLLMAHLRGAQEIMELLLQRGASFDKTTFAEAIKKLFKESPLTAAALLDNTSSFDDEFLQKAHKYTFNPALTYALAQGNLKTTQRLLAQRAKRGELQELQTHRIHAGALLGLNDPTVTDERRKAYNEIKDYIQRIIDTELQEAVRSKNPERLKQAVGLGANIREKGENDETPLHRAAADGFIEAVNVILENDKTVDINAVTKTGQTPLHCAANNGHLAVAEALLKRQPLLVGDKQGKTPLHCAAARGHIGIASLLLDAGSDVNAVTQEHETPLHCAAEGKHADVVDLLLKRGAQVNCLTATRETPLHLAARHCHTQTIQLLLKNNAFINPKNCENKTPFKRAVLESDKGSGHASIRLLLKAGAIIHDNDERDGNIRELEKEVVNVTLTLAFKKHPLLLNALLGEADAIARSRENLNSKVLEDAFTYAIAQGQIKVVQTLIPHLLKESQLSLIEKLLKVAEALHTKPDNTITEAQRHTYWDIIRLLQQTYNLFGISTEPQEKQERQRSVLAQELMAEVTQNTANGPLSPLQTRYAIIQNLLKTKVPLSVIAQTIRSCFLPEATGEDCHNYRLLVHLFNPLHHETREKRLREVQHEAAVYLENNLGKIPALSAESETYAKLICILNEQPDNNHDAYSAVQKALGLIRERLGSRIVMALDRLRYETVEHILQQGLPLSELPETARTRLLGLFFKSANGA
jgi:ankyrin repeat protein